MFFQGSSSVLLLTPQGKNPNEEWLMQGNVKKIFDKSVKGYVFNCEGGNTTKLQIPKNTRSSLGLTHRFIVFQVLISGGSKTFSIEFSISDSSKARRRIVISSSFREVVINPLHAQIPLSSVPRGVWLNLCFDMVFLLGDTFSGQSFPSVDAMSICGTCKIRRIFTMREAPIEINGTGIEYVQYDQFPRAETFPATMDSVVVTHLFRMDKKKDIECDGVTSASAVKKGEVVKAGAKAIKKKDESLVRNKTPSGAKEAKEGASNLPSQIRKRENANRVGNQVPPALEKASPPKTESKVVEKRAKTTERNLGSQRNKTPETHQQHEKFQYKDDKITPRTSRTAESKTARAHNAHPKGLPIKSTSHDDGKTARGSGVTLKGSEGGNRPSRLQWAPNDKTTPRTVVSARDNKCSQRKGSPHRKVTPRRVVSADGKDMPRRLVAPEDSVYTLRGAASSDDLVAPDAKIVQSQRTLKTMNYVLPIPLRRGNGDCQEGSSLDLVQDQLDVETYNTSETRSSPMQRHAEQNLLHDENQNLESIQRQLKEDEITIVSRSLKSQQRRWHLDDVDDAEDPSCLQRSLSSEDLQSLRQETHLIHDTYGVASFKDTDNAVVQNSNRHLGSNLYTGRKADYFNELEDEDRKSILLSYNDEDISDHHVANGFSERNNKFELESVSSDEDIPMASPQKVESFARMSGSPITPHDAGDEERNSLVRLDRLNAKKKELERKRNELRQLELSFQQDIDLEDKQGSFQENENQDDDVDVSFDFSRDLSTLNNLKIKEDADFLNDNQRNSPTHSQGSFGEKSFDFEVNEHPAEEECLDEQQLLKEALNGYEPPQFSHRTEDIDTRSHPAMPHCKKANVGVELMIPRESISTPRHSMETMSNRGFSSSLPSESLKNSDFLRESVADSDLDLMFDPILNCYYDPKTNKYYELR